MKPLRALISKKNIEFSSSAGKSFFVWPVGEDYKYLNNHPHWIEITMYNTHNYEIGKCFIYDKKRLIKDLSNFKDNETKIYSTELSQDELIEKLEKYKIKFYDNVYTAFASEKWIEAYTLQEFKDVYL